MLASPPPHSRVSVPLPPLTLAKAWSTTTRVSSPAPPCRLICPPWLPSSWSLPSLPAITSVDAAAATLARAAPSSPLSASSEVVAVSPAALSRLMVSVAVSVVPLGCVSS
ncbi:hypothetical protein D3C81_1578090 [compost metagenome]